MPQCHQEVYLWVPNMEAHSISFAPSLGFPKTSDIGTRKNNMDFYFVIVQISRLLHHINKLFDFFIILFISDEVSGKVCSQD